MYFWNKTPLFRMVFPFIVGILAGYYFEIPSRVLLAGIVFFSLLFVISFFLKNLYGAFALRIYFGGLIHLLLFLFGCQLTVLEKDTKNELFLKNNSTPSYYLCTLLKPLKETEKCYAAEVEIYAVKQKNGWTSTCAKTLVYLKKGPFLKLPEYGDCLLLHTLFTEIQEPQNPNELDYKKLAGLKGFHYKAFLKSNEWKILHHRKFNFLKEWAFELRRALFSILKKYLPEKQEYGVAEALIAGSMEDIDPELSQAYSAAGVIHVLSVSGLHIGLVYMVLNALLFFLNQNKILLGIKCILLICFLWFYAVLSGFSPSVLRAAMMLSLVIYGRTIGSPTNTFNTLAASAFLLLVFSPFLIFNLGFQLSYLAVSGILLIHPILYKQWVFKHYLFDKIWQLISVSVGAQVFTFPLILFHFHQMPTYFILANLIVIPLATIILFSGIALIVAVKCSWLCTVIASFMHILLMGINFTVQQIEAWPYALLRNFSINCWDMAFLYICMLCLLAFYHYRTLSTLISGLVLLLIFQINQAYATYLAVHQKKIIIYSISKITAIDFIEGYKATLLCDSSLSRQKSKFLFHIQPNRYALKIKNSECHHLIMLNNNIQFFNIKTYLANSASPIVRSIIPKKIFLDFIINSVLNVFQL
jgi:competence protein ComEC